MGAVGNPQSLVPYMNNRDCSQGFCSIYCPQWCYIIFPPPPPPLSFPSDESTSTPNLSPLVIAIIGILVSAFLLIAYYTVISKFCIVADSSGSHENIEAIQENLNVSLQEPWETRNAGLDEALIKSIAVFKYKKGGGIGETDCSVCLSEFQDDESLRLLPKCNHAFHDYCIDRWLKSHSNCPNCRANVVFFPSSLPPPITNHHQIPTNNQEYSSDNDDNAVSDTDRRDPETENVMQSESFRAFRNLGSSQAGDIVIEIRDESFQHIRRSVSVDLSCQQTRIVDILQMNQDDDDVGTSKQSSEMSKSCNKKRIKRSLSSGRFYLTRQGRAKETNFDNLISC